ncbi:UNVERIFIED_ORG: hypothetical protein ABIC43_006090 [Variovorax guangxiensis]
MAVATALIGCGGGGGDNGGGFPVLPPGAPAPAPSPAPAPAPSPAPAPAPVPISADYRFLSFSQELGGADTPEKRFDDYVALLNQQGAAGYRYVEGETGGSFTTFSDDFLMVKEGDATYTYEYRKYVAGSGIDVLLQQMKEQGAKGMQYIKVLGQVRLTPSPQSSYELAVLYRRDAAANTTYDYAAIPQPTTSGDFVGQGNAQGANGFRPWATPPVRSGDGSLWQFFVKDMKSAARYEVKALMSPLSTVGGTEDDLKAQVRAQGAQGYRLLKNGPLENSNDFILYVKDTTQSSLFEYEFLTAPDSRLSAAYATQANGRTGVGLRYFSKGAVYFRSSACTGSLCVSPDATERIPLN